MITSTDDDVERQHLELDDLEALEKEAVEAPPARHGGIHPIFFIGSWIFFSNVTILLNKWLLDTAGFRYPILLTTYHLLFATVATQLLSRFTPLLDTRHGLRLTPRIYCRAILPIGICYSASLVCSNLTYLYLSVAFTQMLKASAPVAVLLVGWAWGVENPTLRRCLNVLVIVLGVVLASVGEVAFSWVGFGFQVGGILFESMKLVMVQVLLNDGEGGKGMRMDPLVGLYYYAPVCAVMNCLVAAVTEWPSFDYADIGKAGWGMLLLSGVVAFLLNVASVFVIGTTSGLAMCLTGILKNILLVIASVVIWHTAITPLQLLGYAIACFGLVYYSFGWEQMVSQSTAGWAYTKTLWDPSDERGQGMSPQVRRVVSGALAGFSLVFLWWWFLAGDKVAEVAAVTTS